HDVLVVGPTEGLRGVEHTEADVAAAVAESEEPAVAGHEDVLPLRRRRPQLEVALEVVVVVPRGLVVRAHRDGHRAVLALLPAHLHRQAGGDPVRGDDDGGAVGLALTGGAATLVDDLRHDTDDPAVVVEDRLRDVAPLEEGDRKSTRLNSSHVSISYAVLCL